jgi:hypothetical protein
MQHGAAGGTRAKAGKAGERLGERFDFGRGHEMVDMGRMRGLPSRM